nr:hypothetical protein [Tanacetum cinerariifolium]
KSCGNSKAAEIVGKRAITGKVMEIKAAEIIEEKRKKIDVEAEAVQIILTGINNDIYSIVDTYPNAIEMWKAIERLKQEPKVVSDEEATTRDKEIEKLMALISMSFKKIYKPTNKNLRTSSNTRNKNIDNTLRSYKRIGMMSSPNHPTFNIKDAFSSNSPNYTSALPDYSLASPGNTPSESLNNSYGLVPIASPTLSLFHDDPYMKVMHAYDAIIPPQVHIPPPTIMPRPLMLSPIFNPQEFFVLKELLPPKEQVSYLTSSLTDSFNPFWRQACTLVPPSFSVYTPTPPQIFEIGKSSIKIHLKHHEKQTEDILNYLEELSFHRIEKIKERLINGWMII